MYSKSEINIRNWLKFKSIGSDLIQLLTFGRDECNRNLGAQ